MTNNDVQLILDEDVVEIRGVVTGRVVRAPDADGILEKSKVRAVRLTLRNFTEGRGDTDSKVVGRLEFGVSAQGSIDTTFRLEVPHYGIISYDGRLIRVKWEVEARVDIKMGRDSATTVPILVVPIGGWAMYDRAHPLRESSTRPGTFDA